MMHTPWIAVLAALCLEGSAASTAASTGDLPTRDEIDPHYKWRLEDIYPTDQEWEEDFSRLEKEIPDLARYRGRLGEDGRILLEALRHRDRVAERAEKLLVYAGMRHDEDTRLDRYTSMRDRVQTLGNKMDEVLSYLEPEILAMDPDTLWKTVDATEGLSLYRHYLDNILRGRAHTLGAEEEGLLAMAGNVTGAFYNVFSSFQNADVSYGTVRDEDGNEVELTQGRYYRFQESSDRRLREESWTLFHRAYDKFGHTLAANMAGNVKSHVFYARARRYDSALEAAVDANAIPADVYRNLIRTVRENIAPLHRYVALRKKILGVDTLEVWDMAAPLVSGSAKEYPFEEAKRIVIEGLAPLGEEYLAPFRKAFDEGWVDVYETQGKRGGAYSWGGYDTKPYLLLNYTGTLEDVFTLAHEMGHSMHSYFTRANQPYVYGDYPIFLAEVASTTNEALLIGSLLDKTTDHKERLVLLTHYLEQIRGTFFIQVFFADFELRMHENEERGEPVTKESLDRLYADLYREYFGPDLHAPPLNRATWSRIPHFYYNFYVYQYATSYAAATALARRIREEGEPQLRRYLAFLKSGRSDYPVPTLQRAGVDLTRPEPILDTIEVFRRVLDLLEEELAKEG